MPATCTYRIEVLNRPSYRFIGTPASAIAQVQRAMYVAQPERHVERLRQEGATHGAYGFVDFSIRLD
jgi:hypothetical protein